MHFLDWLIVIIPTLAILWLSFHSRKYVHGVVDFLAAGRVAGRYVISVGDMTNAMSIMYLVGLVEMKYQTGYALAFWQFMIIPVSIFMGLTGYCIYRFRETKALSMGQFLEMRYSRRFRVLASTLRTISELLTNAIGPAIAANFFIYYLGLPHSIMIWGIPFPCYGIVVTLVLIMAMIVIWPGGRVSLLLTDCFQGLISYPVFVIITGYLILTVSWSGEIAPTLMDRVPGQSFFNPMDMADLRDFNIFALVVTVISSVLNRASWIGNDTSGSARTPHEQKMAGLLGSWRAGLSTFMGIAIAILIITVMTHQNHAARAKDIRTELSAKISEKVITDEAERKAFDTQIAAIPEQHHVIGQDPPLSQQSNIDTVYLGAAHDMFGDDTEGNTHFQEYRTQYYQMMMPVALRQIFPIGLTGLFCLLMLMLMLSTDDSRIFNASSTLVQDVILPYLKRPLSSRQHLWLLRIVTLFIAVFFWCFSMLFVSLDYINMFTTIMTAIWLGGAGPIMVFGLYSRFGTTWGAYAALLFGSGFSLMSLFLQRNWPDMIYPFLERHGWVEAVSNFLVAASRPFNPYIEWKMSAVKCPINSYEFYFISILLGISSYIIISLITCKKPYNLERMLHRGEYSIDDEKHITVPWTPRNIVKKLVGITPDYTRGDRIIAWSIFYYSIVYKFIGCFLIVLIWNLISPWPDHWWSVYFFITYIAVAMLVGVITTVWFMIGGILDVRRLFRDLKDRIDNPLDDGRVEGGVSLMDQAAFDAREHKYTKKDQ
ncbi:hypothetical protein [Ruficoccus sp. ZRK36]|uniref:sodium:solute symporter family protein n=1 Tax=Ruficoccus sp. ZRK36 TaxID=2866311 RepID=UPI001C72FDB6|nr:hypothetical protein [Ruficoccus sp. ZRK36]QYY34382.1 hypothetical protein K0V07_08650 [Ruficoccus sp. ZRK36]